MPAATRQRVPVFPTPELSDLIFWERDTLSRADYTDLVNDGVRAYGTPHPDSTRFPNHTLCYWVADPDFQGGADGQDSLRVRKYYVADRTSQDDYNFEFTAADIGGQKFNAVQRTYITPRSSWDESSPAPGAAMSTDPSGKFPAGYILAARKQGRTGEKELDALYVVEVRTYVERTTIISQKFDTTTEGVLETIQTLYYRTEKYSGTPIETQATDSTVWGLSAAGVLAECQQLSDNWWMVTSTEVLPQGLPAAGALGVKVRQWESWENYRWPDVLNTGSFVFSSIGRKDGSSTTTVEVQPLKRGGSYPTMTRRTQYWSDTPVAEGDMGVTHFKTESFDYHGAQYRTGANNFLTTGIVLIDNIGTVDPVYSTGTYGVTVGATSPTTWPAAYTVVGFRQEPFRGGYLITRTEIKAPF